MSPKFSSDWHGWPSNSPLLLVSKEFLTAGYSKVMSNESRRYTSETEYTDKLRKNCIVVCTREK